MQLTKNRLRQIIKEELGRVLSEQEVSIDPGPVTTPRPRPPVTGDMPTEVEPTGMVTVQQYNDWANSWLEGSVIKQALDARISDSSDPRSVYQTVESYLWQPFLDLYAEGNSNPEALWGWGNRNLQGSRIAYSEDSDLVGGGKTKYSFDFTELGKCLEAWKALVQPV